MPVTVDIGRQPRILVIDGEPHQRHAVSHLLSQAGYAVQQAATGEQGLRVVQEMRPDLVLLAVTLPDMDGFQVCQCIKSDAALAYSFVVLLSSTGADPESLAAGLEGGADECIARPVSDRELLARVQALLRIKRTEESLRIRTRELEERIKQLNCLYGISRLVERAGASLPEILQGTADLLTPAWQYPEVACARVVLDGQEFRTDGFRETAWGETRGILVHGQPAGRLEVCYLEERPVVGEGPFTESESSLLGAIAERLGRVAERMRAEQDLRKLSQAIEQSSSVVVITDAQGNIEYVNPGFTQVTGFNADEVLGRSPNLLSSTQHTPEFYHSLWATISAGQEWRGEFINRKKSGELYWESASITPVRDAAGAITHFIKVADDVTGRRQAEKALRESEARYRQLIDNLQEGIWVLDQDACTTFVNPRLAEMLGYTEEEMLGRHLFDFMAEEQIPVAQLNLERRRKGIREQHDFQFLRQDGTPIYTSLETAPVVDSDGNYVGALAGVMDVTERRRAEESLREAKEIAEAARREEQARRQEAEQRRHIAEALGDVLAVLNSNRSLSQVLDYIARRAGDLLGTRAAAIYQLETETGKLSVQATRGLLVTYVAGARIPIGRGALRRAMASRQPVVVSDLATPVDDGADLALSAEHRAAAGTWAKIYRALLAVPIVVQDEVYGGMLLYYAEPRVFSEEEVELAGAFADQVALAIGNARLREQVERAAVTAERDRLARDLHDAVTQTLFSASLIAEALPRVWARSPEEGRRGLEELRRLTRGAAAEMRTLLVELRPAALTEKPLGELLRHLTEAMAGRVRVPIDLEVDGDSILPEDVQIALYRIVQEALNNAAKHAGASRVSVELHCQPRGAILRISDDGSGFDLSDVLPDRFGLGIMRERAQGIGAILQMDSQPGQGTRLVVDWHEVARG